jgi:tetratricopeptide (TPR) repeat protein
MLIRCTLVVIVCLLGPAVAWAQPRRNEVPALNEAGWSAIQRREPDRAAALFAEALSMRPNDAVLLLGAGVAAHLRGRSAEAIPLLQQSIASDPTLLQAVVLLGEIAYREGDLALAVRTYEEAVKRAPGDAGLQTRLKAWRAEADAHRNFEEVRYDRFRVMFEGRADQSLAVRATGLLDSAFRRIGQTLGAFPSQPVVVVLYTEQQFRDITNAPDWSAAQYDGRVRVPVRGALDDPSLFERVLVHELTHAMVTNMAARGVPAWLHEGLAQHFEGEDASAARRRMATARAVPLRHLEGGFDRMTAAQAQVAYDQSLLAVSVMAERPGFGWSNLLNDLASGQRFDQAIERFGLSYQDLEAPFRRRR